MADVVVFDGFSLKPQGPTLSLSLSMGQCLVLAGPSGGGKTHFLRTLLGSAKPAQGRIEVQGRMAVAGLGRVSSRTPLENLARRYAGRNSERAAAILHDLRLWDVRERSLQDLPSGHLAAAELLPALLPASELVVLDGQLDRLDPWAFQRAKELIRKRCETGTSFVIASQRTDIAPLADLIAILVNQEVKFAGEVSSLIRGADSSRVTVVSENQMGVRALVEPFRIKVRSTEKGVEFQAEEGQEMVARLLLEGYGDVEFVTLQEPTFESALLAYDEGRTIR